jgi:hypothetical protein
MALALIAAFGSMFITILAALFEIVIGAVAGNTVGLPLTPWIDTLFQFRIWPRQQGYRMCCDRQTIG